MSSVNKVILIGNLGRDPEIKHTQSGTTIAHLSLATSETWKDKHSGERQERTEWHRVVAFGQLAEIAERYLRKGSKVYVEGQLQTRKWTDKSGVERYSTEVLLQGYGGKLVMLSARDSSGENYDRNQSSEQSSPQRSSGKTPDDYDDLDDKIPF